ncbi:uncharacterized protein LOC103316106 [Nasonia vitripennis]|uniref:Peptidase A2 domain-containing protein n=1 Tax=Nasonia vitripennis TaxID=7425 RepID=A0A7M7H4R6_NASVI|nr:uncharacterized protein LOC103316106 [Nasonia vitripennis]
MRRLANNAFSDEAMRVKWLNLLPSNTSRLCRVLPATSLDELAHLADLAIAPEPPVHAVAACQPTPPSSSTSSGTASPQPECDISTLQQTTAVLTATTITAEVAPARTHALVQPVQLPQPHQHRPTRAGAGITANSARRPHNVSSPAPLHQVREFKRAPPLQAEAVGASTERRLHIVDRTSKLRFLVDTGSAVSLLPRTFFKEVRTRGPLTLSAANASAISTYGT